MTTPDGLGQRLAQARREKAVREHRDITQADVAAAVGYSRTAVSEWEAGDKTPREPAVKKLAAYLGVTPEFLRYGVRTPRVQLTEAEIAAAIEKSGQDRAARGLPPIGPEDVIEDPEPELPASKTKAAGGQRPPKPSRGGK